MGTTDGYIAFEELQGWHLPDHICCAVKNYYTPEETAAEYSEIAALTQYAYVIANASGVGTVGGANCVDLDGTWIVKDASAPLDRQKTRQTYVQRIFETVKEKSQTIANSDSAEDEETLANTSEEEMVISAARKTPQKQGFFSWLVSWFRQVVCL